MSVDMDKQIETAERLTRIETKLDLHLSRTDAAEGRLKALEAKVNYYIGGCAVIAIAAPFVLRKFFGV